MKSNFRQFFGGEINLPFYIFYPKKLEKKISEFKTNFKGKVIYAFKANPSDLIIDLLKKNGINSFDVSSINEIKKIKKIVPLSNIFFMNPVKPREAIKEAYKIHNVKNFAVDSFSEYKKILEETNYANDLNIYLRLKILSESSVINLKNKFGLSRNEAENLLKIIRKKSLKIGICFHVGSQCMNPKAYKIAIEYSKKIVEGSGVQINYLNVGGGFPSNYENYKSPQLKAYMSVVNNSFSKIFHKNSSKIKLLAEPGRSIVSECMSLVVKVNSRKNRKLYINDGIHGSLNNAGLYNFIYPVKLFGRKDIKSKLKPFSFYGPTCDSKDFIKGPYYLPDSIGEGDYIELFNMGAYSITMKTNFNGFYNKTQFFSKNKNGELLKIE